MRSAIKMKLYLRVLGAIGLLCAVLFTVVRTKPPAADAQRVYAEALDAKVISYPATHQLGAAIGRDAELAHRAFHDQSVSHMALVGIITLGSVACLTLSMRKGRWIETKE